MTALKVYAQALCEPPHEPGDPRRRYTLRDCFDRYVHPELVDELRAQATFRQYRSFLAAWERLTGDPPLEEITPELLRDWKQARAAETSHATFDKDLRMYRRVMNLIGPRTRFHRNAAEILPWWPDVKPFGKRGVRVKPKRPVSAADWSALYRAARCSFLSHCPRVPGPVAMQSAIVCVYSTALREGDLFSLQWGHVFLDEKCPVPGWTVTNPQGWLYLSEENPHATALACAAKTGKPHVIPLTRCLRRQIDLLRSMIGGSGRLGPADERWLLPLGGPAEVARKERLAFLHAVNRAAGFDEPHLTWQSLRLGANEAWDTAHPQAGSWLLQHAMSGVNAEFYQTGLPKLLRAISQLEEPFD